MPLNLKSYRVCINQWFLMLYWLRSAYTRGKNSQSDIPVVILFDWFSGYSDCLTGSLVTVIVWLVLWLQWLSDWFSGYSGCVTGFHEPPLPPYRCYTILKKCVAQLLSYVHRSPGTLFCAKNCVERSWQLCLIDKKLNFLRMVQCETEWSQAHFGTQVRVTLHSEADI